MTSWVWRKRAGRRARWHHEAPDWVRSGKGLCGADLRNTAWEWSDDIAPAGRKRLLEPPQRFGGVCKLCLKRLAS